MAGSAVSFKDLLFEELLSNYCPKRMDQFEFVKWLVVDGQKIEIQIKCDLHIVDKDGLTWTTTRTCSLISYDSLKSVSLESVFRMFFNTVVSENLINQCSFFFSYGSISLYGDHEKKVVCLKIEDIEKELSRFAWFIKDIEEENGKIHSSSENLKGLLSSHVLNKAKHVIDQQQQNDDKKRYVEDLFRDYRRLEKRDMSIISDKELAQTDLFKEFVGWHGRMEDTIQNIWYS